VTEPENPPAAGPGWRLAYAAAAVLVVLVVLALYRLLFPVFAGEPAATPAPAVADQVVEIVIERPDAEPYRQSVPWTADQTAAEATRRLSLPSEWRGAGEMAFLESLDGVANQGADGLNWQVEVNGRYAERGAGALRLRPGDRVLWRLAPYE